MRGNICCAIARSSWTRAIAASLRPESPSCATRGCAVIARRSRGSPVCQRRQEKVQLVRSLSSLSRRLYDGCKVPRWLKQGERFMVSSTGGRASDLTGTAWSPASSGARLSELRQIYGVSARSWIGMGLRRSNDSITPLRWLPGGPNSVLVHGPHSSVLHDAIEEIVESGAPAELVVDGAALGNVQVLIDAGWVCIGSRPLMRRLAVGDVVRAFRTASGVVEVSSAEDLDAMRQIMKEALGTDLGGAGATARDGQDPASNPRRWALYEDGTIVSCATTVQVEDAVVLWDVATRPGCQKRGLGTALLDQVHSLCAQQSAVSQFLLSSSAAGYRLYESLGYETVGWWQAWSRPRWALGQA